MFMSTPNIVTSLWRSHRRNVVFACAVAGACEIFLERIVDAWDQLYEIAQTRAGATDKATADAPGLLSARIVDGIQPVQDRAVLGRSNCTSSDCAVTRTGSKDLSAIGRRGRLLLRNRYALAFPNLRRTSTAARSWL